MVQDDLHKLTIKKGAVLARPPRRGKLVFPVIVFFLVGAVILLVTGVFAPKTTVETVIVSQLYPSQSFTLLNASGYVVAQRKAALASKITGLLEWLGVEEGSHVRKDQILARLESRDMVAAKEQAEENLNTAMANLEQTKVELTDSLRALRRQRELIAQGIVAQADYETIEARHNRAKAAVAGAESAVKAAQATLRGATVAVDYSLIRAPFDGVVLTKNADVGDIVTPLGAAANAKSAVVTLADMESLQVEADVSEANLAKVRTGQSCEIQLDALPDVRFRGVLHTIVPTADRSKASVLVKVRFLNRDPRILPEMSAKVAFLERPVKNNEQRPRTALNPAAVLSRTGKQVVFVVKNERVFETYVTLGGRIGEMVEVLGGVKAGDTIVIRPLEKLRDGAKIKMAEK
jgi:RND family efflux transporter MFP subunit